MNEAQMRAKVCPIMSSGEVNTDFQKCVGSACALWEWNEPLYNGPDSYVSEPGPEGGCGLIARQRKVYGEV